MCYNVSQKKGKTMKDLLILYNPYYQSNVIKEHLAVLKTHGQVAFGKVRSKLKDKFGNLGVQNANFSLNLGTNSKQNLNLSGENSAFASENSNENLNLQSENLGLNLGENTNLSSENLNLNAPKHPQTSSLQALQNLLESSNSPFLQLFLTDYASLYVAKVVKIAENADESIIPSYYKDKKLSVEGFFIIEDLRELVRDDFVSVRDEYLANFTTPDYDDHTYALYGNAYVYPLIIEQKQHLAYFESDERHFLQLFKSAEFLRQKQVLADYTFGKQYLYAMNPDSFDNLIYAELEFHACKGDRLYDFSSVVLRYAKCFESECYLLIKRLISVLSQRDESVLSLTFTQMGKSFEVRSLLTNKAVLGTYNHLIDSLLKAHIKKHLSDEFVNVCRKLSKQIAFIQRVRNPAAHTECTSFEQANNLRARLVGVATQSVLVMIIKARTQLLKV